MRRKAYTLLSVVIASVLVFPQHGWGQEARNLEILVLSGEAATNDVETRAVTEPVVEVRNRQGDPVPSAKVVFRCPAVGPSATFYGASRTVTLTTDEAGRARAAGMMSNTEPRDFFIDVTATHGALKGDATIAQTNVLTRTVEKKKRRFGWRFWAAMGAAAAIGAAAAVRRSKNPTPQPVSNSLGSAGLSPAPFGL